MDSNSAQLCRLCLQYNDNLVNVFDQYEDATIASILAKHFWFQVFKNDGFTEWLCQICWTHTKNFHSFYRGIELLQANYCMPNDVICADSIKQERSVSPIEEVLEFVKCEIKCEVQCDDTKLKEMVVMPINEENSSDDVKDCDENENSHTSDEEDQFFNKKQKADHVEGITVTEKQTLTANIKSKFYNTHSRSETEKQNAQIREFFNMKCEICNDVEFDSLLKARQHYRKAHDIKGYIVCCEKKFYRRYLILNHMRRHLNPDAFRCDQCGKCFKNKYNLRDHINNHVPLDSRPLKCSLCSSSFTKATALKAHVQHKHTAKTGEMFPCEKCNKEFQSKLLLTCHIRSIHEFSSKHVCEICALQFKTKTSLQHHIDYQHPTTPLPKVQCNICGAWLKNEDSLRRHIKLHGRNEYDLVNCPICKKAVKDKKLLGSHIRHVHGERNHQCTLCDKAFKTATILKEHLASHTGEDLYDCMFCEKKFKSSANMYSHRKKAHLAEWTQYLEKKRME